MASASPKLKRLELKPSPYVTLQKALGVRSTTNMWIDPVTKQLANRPSFLKLNRAPDTDVSANRADNGPWSAFVPASKRASSGRTAFTFIGTRNADAEADVNNIGLQRQGVINIGAKQSFPFGLQLASVNTAVISLSPPGRNMAARTNVAFMYAEPTYAVGYDQGTYRYANVPVIAQGELGYASRLAVTSFDFLPLAGFDGITPNQGAAIATVWGAGRTGILFGGTTDGTSGSGNGFLVWTGIGTMPSAGGGYSISLSGSGVASSSGIVNGAISYRDKYVITWTDFSITAWELQAATMVPVSSSTAAGSRFNFAAVTVGTSVILLTTKGLINLSQEVFKDSLVPVPFIPEYNEVVESFVQTIYRAIEVKMASATPSYDHTYGNSLVSCYSFELNSIFYVSPLTNQCLYVNLGSASTGPFVGVWSLSLGVGNYIRGVYTLPYGDNLSSREVTLALHTYDRGSAEGSSAGMKNQIWVLGDWFTENAIRQGVTLNTGAGSSTNRADKVALAETVSSSVDYVFGDGLVDDNVSYTGVELKNLEFGLNWGYNYPSQSGTPSITLDVLQNKTSGTLAVETDSFPIPATEVLELREDGYADPYVTARIKDSRTLRLPFLRSGGSEVIVRMKISGGYSVYLDSVYPTFKYRKREQTVKDNT